MPRMLFVDDTDITTQQGLERVIHPARKHPANPILQTDQPWEEQVIMGGTVRLEPERGYRMWYQSYGRGTYLNLYAESADGVHWQKPVIGRYEDYEGSRQNNLFLSRMALRSNHLRPPRVNQDHNPNVLYTPHLGPERRYTLLSYDYARSGYVAYDGYCLAFSPDGLEWHDGPAEPVIPGHADVGWFTYDPLDRKFRGIVKSFYNIRGYYRRSVNWTESVDGYDWVMPRPAVVPDLEDEAWGEGRAGHHTQFYGMPIARYESVLLGFLQKFRVTAQGSNQDGEIDVQLTCSRDGRDWRRVGNRQAIVTLGEAGSWDSGAVLTGNSLVVAGDEVRIYYSGADHTHDQRGQTRVGLATWSRDRLVGLRAPAAGGTLQTVPHIAGRRLHVNADASQGSLMAELVGWDGQVIAGHEASACGALRADRLDHSLRWQGAEPDLSGSTVAVRLLLEDAEVFSLWWD